MSTPTPPPDLAAPPADAERTSSGLASKVLSPGTGDRHPTARSVVEVHLDVWMAAAGRLLDSSRKGKPRKVDLRKIVPGFTEGVQLMVEGERRRLWVPEELAYQGKPGKPPGMLVFEVELLSFETTLPGTPPKEVPAPPDVAAPPPDAQTTASGLASKVLRPGKGTRHPKPLQQVRVHYTGWTTDGKMFDSSVTRGRPSSFRLDQVIAGWTEGLQLMVEGERRRLWIPVDLAYQGRPGSPAGMLVFDVELLGIA